MMFKKKKNINKKSTVKKQKYKSLKAFSYEKMAFFFIWLGIILILAHLVLFYFDDLLFKLLSSDVIMALGQFGEYYSGVVGAIWALAGVILFYEALKFQRRELTLQRHELELHRNEIMEQTHQLRLQNDTLSIQRFEELFFQLLTLHNQIIDSTSTEGIHIKVYKTDTKQTNTLFGRDCFHEFYERFKYKYSDTVDLIGITSPTMEDSVGIINESFGSFFQKRQADLGHYFRNIQNLLEFIDQSESKEKGFYSNLVHGHLSNYEIMLLFYYGVTKLGSGLKPFLEKYSFFTNIPDSELLDFRHKGIYDDSAFSSDSL